MDLDILLSIEYWEQYGISSYENLNLVLNIYKNIINQGDRNLKYYERHHMVPKSFDANLMSDSNNIIICTYEEHFNIHKLLANCFSGIFKNKMIFAYQRLCYTNRNSNGEKYKVSAEEYAELKIMLHNVKIPEEVIKRRSETFRSHYYNDSKMQETRRNIWLGRHHTEETKKKIGIASRNRIISDETREKISRGNTGKRRTLEQRKLMSEQRSGNGNPFYGKRHTEETRQRLSESHQGLEPWNKGKTMTEEQKRNMYGQDHQGAKNPAYGKVCVTNGVNNRRVSEELVDNYLENGWWKGMTADRSNVPAITWSESSRKKLSESQTGMMFVNNGEVTKRIPGSQLDQYLEEGWRRGMIRRNKNKLDNNNNRKELRK